MEENEVQEEVEVESEVTEEESSAFDAAFEDDDFDLSEESGKEEEPQEETEGESEDGQPADDPGAEQTEETEQTPEEQGTETEAGNQRFKLKFLGTEEEYDLDQFTELAQKGRNYDHVVEERDKLKGESDKHKAFLQKLADRAGVSIDEQIDLTEAMWLMDEEAEKGNSLTEAEALLRVQRNRNQPPQEEQQTEQQNPATQMIDRFLSVYPNVKATDIPKEVWEQATRTGDLLGAYQANEIRRLKEENEKVKKDAQNERNAQRSTGPRKTSGSSKDYDDFDAGWNSDDD
jgi:hypothetical protein